METGRRTLTLTLTLTASAGKVLTNGEDYGSVIYLGCNDKPENWHEITYDEYNEIYPQEEPESEVNI